MRYLHRAFKKENFTIHQRFHTNFQIKICLLCAGSKIDNYVENANDWI